MSIDRPLSAHEQQDRMFGGSSEPSNQHRDATPTDRPDSERDGKFATFARSKEATAAVYDKANPLFREIWNAA